MRETFINKQLDMNRTSNRQRHGSRPETRMRWEPSLERYKPSVPSRFLITSMLASYLLAFSVGRATRHFLYEPHSSQKQEHVNVLVEASLPSIENESTQTTYLSKAFEMTRTASSFSWLLNERDTITLIAEENAELIGIENNEHEAVSEHLMVDMQNVDGAFLNSERRLANAMLEVVSEAQLSLVSYHCLGLVPMGVSCVGLLERNYISLHTWPESGVISLDLCVAGTSSLLSALSVIERVFGVPCTSPPSGLPVQKPLVKWAHKFRGFDVDERSNDLSIYVLSDLGTDIKTEVSYFRSLSRSVFPFADLNIFTMLPQVVSVDTGLQKIDIYDTFSAVRMNTLFRRGLHEPRNTLVFQPDRIVMLDGWIQSTLFNEAAYHEALVHPALFAHANPKRVAIIGGGEGATLREVLKHKSVEEAVMIEIDEMMVNVSRQYIPEWSDCSDLVGSVPWCVDDSRAKVYYEDALAWFIDRYSQDNSSIEPMDVVIMDAL